MCLTKTYKKHSKWNRGYKVLKVHSDGTIHSPCVVRDDPLGGYRFGAWYCACTGARLSTDDGSKYTAGFHVYKNEEDAWDHANFTNSQIDFVFGDESGTDTYIVVEVECEEPLAFGYQEYYSIKGRKPVGVFAKMRIVRQVKKNEQ